MRFLHLGDLHLGKSIGEFDLIDDQRYLLDQILEIITEHSVQGILLAGDIYDKSIPSEGAVRLFDYFLNQLKENGVAVFVISGNHDSDERLNFGSSLFEVNHIHISAKYDGQLRKCVFEDEDGKVNIYLLPFIKASQVKHFYPDESIKTYEDAIRVVLAHTEINPAERNVLVAHQFVIGKGQDPELGGSEGLAVHNVGTVEKIGYDCFNAFDYVALGHIHSAQRVGRETVRYSGSLMKYSLSEIHAKKSIPLITIRGEEEVDIQLLELKPKRDMRHLKGKMKNLLDAANVTDTDDFIYVTLTDETIIENVMGIFQQVYPNTIKIDFDNAYTKELEQVGLSDITEHKSFDELIGDFYRQMYDMEMSAEELELMKVVAREAGVLHEAD